MDGIPCCHTRLPRELWSHVSLWIIMIRSRCTGSLFCRFESSGVFLAIISHSTDQRNDNDNDNDDDEYKTTDCDDDDHCIGDNNNDDSNCVWKQRRLNILLFIFMVDWTDNNTFHISMKCLVQYENKRRNKMSSTTKIWKVGQSSLITDLYSHLK